MGAADDRRPRSGSVVVMSVYDDPVFLAGYRQLRRDGLGLNSALEIPALAALLPPVAGLRVVDLGCGEGELAVRLATAGAAEVIAVDLSASMLSRAREHPSVRYVQSDIATFDLPADSVDLVVSSLALHYVKDFNALVARIARWLSPAGQFTFSIEHPVITAPFASRRPPDRQLRQRGPQATNLVRQRRTEVPPHCVVPTDDTTPQRVLFVAVEEPQPTPAQVKTHPHLAIHRRRPPLLLISALHDS